MEVRSDVLKSLETARNEKLIGAPLEARVRLSGEWRPLSAARTIRAANCPACSSSRRWRSDKAGAGSDIGVKVERAAGAKCERCWKYTTDVGSNAAFPTDLRAAAPAAVDEMSNG